MGTGEGNKKIKILVTAGPTWVRIDRVRVLTNIFSGKTGFLIARAFRDNGFRVTLLLGPSMPYVQDKGINIIRFKYFEDLRRLLRRELRDKGYKAVIHSAAVSDYKPVRLYIDKIPSSKKELLLRLKPAPKIIRDIRKIRRDIFLIQFKLEVNKSAKDLKETAYMSLVKNSSDFVVANDLKNFKGSGFKSYIIDKHRKVRAVRNRRELAYNLVDAVKKRWSQ